jgi:TolA-binding protein
MGNAFRYFLLLCCLSIQLAWGVLFFPAPIMAVTDPSLPELQQKQQQIDRYRSNVTQAKQRLEQQEQSTRDRLDGLQQQIDTTSKQQRISLSKSNKLCC